MSRIELYRQLYLGCKRERDYLRYITQKIRRENRALLPFEPNFGGIVTAPFGVYELISLSMPTGKKMPVVEFETHGKIWKDYLLKDSDDKPLGLVLECEVDFRGNDNVQRFLRWLNFRDPNPLNVLRVSGIYLLLEKQAEIDENRRRASLN